MPLISVRKAIRFKSMDKMVEAVDRDDDYQHRHLVIYDMLHSPGPTTRRAVCESTNLPANAVSKIVSCMITEGVVKEAGKVVCPITGRNSKGIVLDTQFKGPY